MTQFLPTRLPKTEWYRRRKSKASSIEEQSFSDLMKDLSTLSERQWGWGGTHRYPCEISNFLEQEENFGSFNQETIKNKTRLLME